MKKIALFGQKDWSLGNSNFHLKKYLSPYYQVDVVDWHSTKEIKECLSQGYDLIIGPDSIIRLEELGYKIPPFTKLVPMFRNGTLNQETPYFNINHNPNQLKKHHTCATSKMLKSSVEKKFGVEVGLLPLGICPSSWSPRDLTPIQKLGHVSKPHHSSWEGYESVKRFGMFKSIANFLDLEYDHVYGKHFSEGVKIYEGFDMVICTSTGEGQPAPFLECAACKIPFISTKVGIVPEYSSVKTFDTIEEAVEIVNYLKSSPQTLQKYVNEVYDEVISDRNWERIINKYWLPKIENILKK